MKQFNMKNAIIAILVLVAIVGAGLWLASNKDGQLRTFSGTTLGPESATTTNFSWPASGRVIKTGDGVLGSIIIGNATAVGTLTLYDGTTTQAHANHATTTLAVINTGTLSGTYSYNVAFTRGLIAVMTATFATSTITSQ